MEPLAINAFIAGIAIFLVFLGGVVVGHRYGLLDEKRREFNAIVGAIRDDLTSRFDPALSQFPSLPRDKEKLVLNMMSPFHRHVFHKIYKAYLDAINAPGLRRPDGSVHSVDASLIEKHFRKVIEHLRDK